MTQFWRDLARLGVTWRDFSELRHHRAQVWDALFARGQNLLERLSTGDPTRTAGLSGSLWSLLRTLRRTVKKLERIDLVSF